MYWSCTCTTWYTMVYPAYHMDSSLVGELRRRRNTAIRTKAHVYYDEGRYHRAAWLRLVRRTCLWDSPSIHPQHVTLCLDERTQMQTQWTMRSTARLCVFSSDDTTDDTNRSARPAKKRSHRRSGRRLCMAETGVESLGAPGG
jgi:hypothetical protein